MMAQEMNAIKALKRLSIGALPTLDPDLPNYSADLYRHPSDPTSNSASLLQNTLAIPSASDGLDFSSQTRSYSDGLTSSSPSNSDSDNISFDSTEIDASHASQLLWVPANVHPELALRSGKHLFKTKLPKSKPNIPTIPNQMKILILMEILPVFIVVIPDFPARLGIKKVILMAPIFWKKKV